MAYQSMASCSDNFLSNPLIIKFKELSISLHKLFCAHSFVNVSIRWNLPTHNRFSDICSICKQIEKTEGVGCIHNDSIIKEVKDVDEIRSSSFKELSSQFFSERSRSNEEPNTSVRSVTRAEEVKSGSFHDSNVQEGGSVKLSTVSKLSSSAIAENHFKQINFKSLFENEKDKIYGWELLEMASEVIIEFKEGNRYEGKLSSCRMHGLGKFHWADGSIYEGDFLQGAMTGEGCLEWPDLSWYEGELLQGLRHGRGLYAQGEQFYCGEWACGWRNGRGAMYYDRRNTGRDYYDGEWRTDYKQEWGVRSYPCGAVYSGQWAAGKRHGLGTMVWTNNDVYMGNWEGGKMNGYGEYTWATFFNNQLVVPQENCFYGNWENGIRNGNGTLETSLGVIVRGTWENGKKNGPAEVVCSNGTFIYAENLFTEDSISRAPETLSISTSVPNSARGSILNKPSHETLLYKVPMNAANHNINLSFYTERLNDYMIECTQLGKSFGKTTSPKPVPTNRVFNSKRYLKSFTLQYGSPFVNETEESLLRNMILQFLSSLKVVYTKYSELCCREKPKFNSVLMRLMLWQLLKDCYLHQRGTSLADFDILIANNKATLVQGVHYPFERLQFWQFIHCLLEVSWELYGKHGVGTPSVQGVLASAFHKLITVDVLPNAGWHKGSALFKYKNFLSLDAVYWFYRGLGEPVPARKLLKIIFDSSQDSFYQHHAREYPQHLLRGKNMIGVGGKLTYHPDVEPFAPETKWTADSTHPQDLTCLSGVGLLSVFECLLQTCPSIASGGLVVNMGYMIVFLEFYEILLLCTNLYVRKKIEESRIVKEESIANVSQAKPETNTEEQSEKQITINDKNVYEKSSQKKKKKK